MDRPEKVILKDFSPEKVAPGFLNFLRKGVQGKITIGKEVSAIYLPHPTGAALRHVHSIKVDALEKTVYLDGQEIGKLRVSIFPEAVQYEGSLPFAKPYGYADRSAMIRSGHLRVDEARGIEWRTAILTYYRNHSLAQSSGKSLPGRVDGWKVPLP